MGVDLLYQTGICKKNSAEVLNLKKIKIKKDPKSEMTMTSSALQFLPGDPDPLYSWEGQGNSLATAILFPV